MTDQSRAEQFTTWLCQDVVETTAALGYTPTRFLQMVRQHGGVEACKLLLRPEIPASHGFCRLRELGRLDLSVEHIAQSPEWADLFTVAEKDAARWRIENADAICADRSLLGE